MNSKLFLLLLLFSCCCFSQGHEKLPLKKILDQIAAMHEVKFSYIEQELIVYTMVPPDSKLPLEAKLTYIENHTRLRFEAGAKGYYTLYNDHKMDKPLCGFLIDAATGTGIENAYINMPGVAAVTSNAKGYFELPVLASTTIEIRHVGYEPQLVDPQDLYVPDCPSIKMKAVVEKLVEITAQRYVATGITKNDFGTLTVRPGKFGILPGLTEPDILQTMQQIPGIVSVDETVSNINVRGGTHDQNLFMWNGIRMFQTGHFFGLLSAFNPLLATRITVAKNGSSAFFGESVSSYVDITSHTKAIDSCYNVVTADMISANFFSKIRLSKDATIQAAGRRTYTDVFITPTFETYEDRVFTNNSLPDNGSAITDKDFYFYDFSIQYHERIGGRHEFIVDGIGVENTVGFLQHTPISQKESRLSQKNFGASLHWKTQWSDKQSSEIQGYYSWYNLNAENETFTAAQQTIQQNGVRNLGLRFSHNAILSDRVEINAGYQLDHLSMTNTDAVKVPAEFRTQKEVSQSHAFIAESNYESRDAATKIQVGIRANYFEKYDLLRLEPRLSLSHALTRTFKIELLGELKSQTLSQVVDQQQDFLGIQNKRWVLANENTIPIQTSNQVSLGFTYSDKGWLLTLDNFYKKIAGITTAEQGFRNQLESSPAVGNYRVFGTELLLQKNFTHFFSWISYSYNDNRYQFGPLLPSEFRNTTAISHMVSCAGIYEWKRFQLALGARWHTGTPYTTVQRFIADAGNPENSQILYNDPNGARLDDYFQVNCSASKTWDLNSKMSITASVSVLNMLDTKNLIGRYYRIDTAANTLENVDTRSLGITPNACLRLNF
jgi:hypothetical protein